MSLLTSTEQYLFRAGTWRRMDAVLGAHTGAEGTVFALWAPDAAAVSAVGEWNGWDSGRDRMLPCEGGLWRCVCPDAVPGMLYKFAVTAQNGEILYKSDPMAFFSECPPGTASRIAVPSAHTWQDGEWTASRSPRGKLNIYELHAGSWKRHEDGSYYTWDELRTELVPYLHRMGYTHAEFLPLAEHPFDGSWGYQVTGFFSPTARFGDPDGLRRLIDDLHNAGIGAICDFVPGHFCRNGNGLGRFCGQKLYEAADHLQWGTYKFDFSRGEVRSFLLSAGIYWLREFHFDGLRVDGVTSMLSLNFGTGQTEYRVNGGGGDDDGDAWAYLRELSKAAREECPGALLAAEESTGREDITRPYAEGGLGFDYKWSLGWMHDTLDYFSVHPHDRGGAWKKLTFPLTYAFSQQFILPFSHDEVVHGKKTLLGRMPGSYEEQFRNLRLLMLWQMLSPGKKLTFMGLELAPYLEWREEESLEWFMERYDTHRSHREYVRALNELYLAHPALWQDEKGWKNFRWLVCPGDGEAVAAIERRGGGEVILAVFNFSDVPVSGYRLPADAGIWRQIFSAETKQYPPIRKTRKAPGSGRVIPLDLPPLSGAVYMRKLSAGQE